MPILLLQHSAEAKHPFTTSRLAALGIDNAALLTGKVFPVAMCLSILTRFSAKRPCLLYFDHNYSSGGDQHSTARRYTEWLLGASGPVLFRLPEQCDALVVLDGTWRNTRELMLLNPWLATLPVLGLAGSSQSEYVLRKSQHQAGLSTIEAIGHVLYCTQAGFDLDAFLRPLRALVEQQAKHFSQ
jgi:DTW domain-containing protein YfiP